MKLNKNVIFGLISIVLIALVALAYNMPVISGNQALLQPDIVNYKGSAESMHQYQKATGENVYWSDAMFSGMPTYQTGASYQYNMIKKIDQVLRFLPRPADYMFLLLAGFFILGLVLFKNWKYALMGAFLFGLGTYFVIIIEAGHNSKAHAIAYFAPLAAGIILLFKRKYILGLLLTTLFMALELNANHPQMTYYFGFVMGLFVIFEGLEAFKQKQIKAFGISLGLSVVALFLALGLNSTNYLATYEYGKLSTRGKNNVTLLQNEHSNHSGLNKDYITAWSYGKLETLNLFIPNFMGGGSTEPETYKKNLQESVQKAAGEVAAQYAAQNPQAKYEEIYPQALASMSQNISAIPTYWGDQPFTSGPAYQGAVVVFLFILGLFLVKGRYKWWLLSATLLSFILAWGKNFMPITDFFIDYVPFYDKFRAVSSILVMAEFTMPLLGALAVYRYFKDKTLSQETKKKILYYAGGGVVLFLVILYVAGGSMFSFTSEIDSQLPQAMAKGIKADRIAMFKADTLRTIVFVMLTLGLFLLYQFKVLKHKEIVIAGIAILSLIDVWGVDKRYLNDENFIPAQWVKNPFPTQMTDRMMQAAQSNPMVMQIAYKIPMNNVLNQIRENDKGHYRVFNRAVNTFNDASTSYFVNAIGGYHGAKLQNYQNIIDVYFTSDSIQKKQLGLSNRSLENILNMLNTRYVIVGNPQESQVMKNPNPAGNAWFVQQVLEAKDDNESIVKIGQIDIKNQAVVNNFSANKNYSSANANIELTKYLPFEIHYTSENANDGFAVFSEVFYDKGWQARIDGKEAPIVQTNYFLRGLEIPKGKHKIVFKFEPKSIQLGSTITLASNVIFALLILGGGFYFYKNRKEGNKI
ncbi:YfhO family protein [Ornithobacterium rhinotracheale]|uniref:YfhO family protein n=1 Tax=Ornithobacterium rhinotracheale TaxID=28251 RepID=UPI001FF45255|nr:YfhO family protein [Ornithobacterium rhinotracheale]MCK0204419.1 YfhO family protein [Ornithobacterium rhinotracheale]